ncbi:FxsB family radical SAM/SPASM domain protein [Frankia canadensis]|uniref:FxsB family radical SAM/SPASM domain protein n=1 Tax=Frankia canadensis TaxID=1836972 RepID=A0A2I2L1W4_9ACTN|nr:FxsB family cyclophane-forming radical SAM/SPASM peptide maturase [Frankia canadensis]SNQ51899.1 FxsB family radical SAM/SPASM domain protein [Frankia canadensis]SOU59189.1 FxsB family radical SAM/SPASM domain protein [Frankia canadensis]
MTLEFSGAGPPATSEWPYNVPFEELVGQSYWLGEPFQQVVLKVHSRCNLSCTYCYVYHQADQGWRDQPVVMSRRTVEATAARVAAHARRHSLADVQIVLHGGEPVLAGTDLLEHVVDTFRDVMPAASRLTFSLQTNATLLDGAMLELCRAREIQIGVSLDGGAARHNRRRPRRNGRDSFDAVRAGLARLTAEPFRVVFGGLLCVVDPANDPVEVYEGLLAWHPPAVDFLLPHGNWSARPPGRVADDRRTPYADWLVTLFDRWYSAPEHETDVRLFEEIIVMLLGGHSRIETVGLTPSAVIVVETDGSLEQVDALKSAYHGAAGTGLHVDRDDLDAALRHPGIVARQIGAAALGAECSRCPVHRVCGGGYYPHRYRPGSGFRNRSVYCPDLFALITHIGRRIRADLDDARRRTE